MEKKGAFLLVAGKPFSLRIQFLRENSKSLNNCIFNFNKYLLDNILTSFNQVVLFEPY